MILHNPYINNVQILVNLMIDSWFLIFIMESEGNKTIFVPILWAEGNPPPHDIFSFKYFIYLHKSREAWFAVPYYYKER